MGSIGDEGNVTAQVFCFAHADRQRTGGFDGGDAGGGVFNADAVADVHPHALCGGEENVRRRFGVGDGGRVGNGVESRR